MSRLQIIGAIIGIILAIPALGAIAWSTVDFRQEVTANTNWRLIQTFERLDAIRSRRKLSQIEWVQWCQAGKELEVFTRCPAR